MLEKSWWNCLGKHRITFERRMIMDIKIEDYLDEQEIKEICKDALYQKIREDMRKLNANDIIANIPSTDVAPVVHGRWESNSDRPDTLICSVCKCGFDMWKHDPHNYCPNCGAKMDEVNE